MSAASQARKLQLTTNDMLAGRISLADFKAAIDKIEREAVRHTRFRQDNEWQDAAD